MTLVAVATSMLLAVSTAACSSDSSPAESSGADDPTTTVPGALPVLFDEVPDDPAQLGSCAGTDDGTDRYTPARWLPTELPEGTSVRFVSHRLPAEVDQDADWSTVLVGTDGDGTVTTAVQATATFVEGGIPGEPPEGRLRGVPGTIVPSSARGSGGAFDAMWVEGDVVWQLVAWGLDEAGFRAAIERSEFEPDAVTDPTGELTAVSWGPVGVRPVTEIDLSAQAGAGARQDLVVVAEQLDGGGGLWMDFTGSAIGMQLGSLDDRPALRGASAETPDPTALNSLRTTAADGSSISASGAVTMDELEALVRSTERVEPDDERLAGIPMTFPLDETTLATTPFCRTER